ncbi:MAG: DUF5011 domain-containing protein [bacterium]|nr:DUF5011 domain-containing protein [bacterium]
MEVPTTRKGVITAALVAIFAVLAPLAWAEVITLTLTDTSGTTTLATADADFASGWQWTVDFTVPDSETLFSMRFSDFGNGSDTIPAAGNVRIYSPQSSDNGDEASAVTIQNNDWSDTMILTADRDEETAGRQISVVVQVKVPAGAKGADFASDFEVRSELPPDTTAPVITLVGDDPVVLTVGDEYTDDGATASDDRDGDITADIVVGGDTVDTDTVGEYTITYKVSDAAGNAADEVTRTVIVNPGGPPPPVCPPVCPS